LGTKLTQNGKPNKKKIVQICREEIISRGVEIACVSLGAEGAILVSRANECFYPALDVVAKGVAGAGDAMVAGLVYAVYHGLPEEEFLACAMAAATASVILDGTEMCSLEGFRAHMAPFVH
jgi:1-phosphofructokinase